MNNILNNFDKNVLRLLSDEKYENQRLLAEELDFSIGTVNKSLKFLNENGYIDDNYNLTDLGKSVCRNNRPKNAIILAAGVGLRMIPLNNVYPKALLEVNGEKIIERLIKQLHEVGIYEIHIVVGFLKEKFEYLIDDYGVNLIVNADYSKKNNLHSLNCASKYINNSYIIPADIICSKNLFRKQEIGSWYMFSKKSSGHNYVHINRNLEISIDKNKSESSNRMIGVSYISGNISDELVMQIKKMDNVSIHDDAFWEEALLSLNKSRIYARIVKDEYVYEINSFEDLREKVVDIKNFESDSMNLICNIFGVNYSDINNIEILKKGMTNRSFIFNILEKKYIMRIPGEGTDSLINREYETNVYKALDSYNITDKVIYMNPNTGVKITEFIAGARVCDSNNDDDVRRCMQKLHKLHSYEIRVDHEFDLKERIEFYESLWEGKKSIFKDYYETKKNVYELFEYIEACDGSKQLAHIDAVPDNFLFDSDGNIHLIDWEYAGMQDPHVDIAMFAIYSFYDKEKTDKLIDYYFEGKCTKKNRIKIYCYMAICGLLWSNWCEYKSIQGVEFGEYSLRQYRYAKDFYKLAIREIGGCNGGQY